MLIRMLDRFPAGRAMVLVVPALLFFLESLVLDGPTIIQITNAIGLALSVFLIVLNWRSMRILFRERESAGVFWLNTSTYGLVLTTVCSITWSLYLHATGLPIDPNSYTAAAIRFSYTACLAGFYLSRRARGPEVPPSGWLSLLGIVTGTTAVALFLMWWF